jgi:hypothetical protein
VGQASVRTNPLDTTISSVELRPGEIGHASIGIETAANFPVATGRPVTVSTLRIEVPGDPAGKALPDRATLCSKEPASTLITPFGPGQPTTAVG